MPAPLILVDTGPLVAYLDRSDPAHGMVRTGWEPLTGRFVTTGAVLTEAMHFLRPLPSGAERLTSFLREGFVLLEDVFSLPSIEAAVSLMSRYADIPMDFADATLVATAGHLGCGALLTLDERGFRTFRYNRTKRFRLLLQDRT
jgi:uncharacterized protein